MSFIISGDTHGTLDLGKVIRFFNEKEPKELREQLCSDIRAMAKKYEGSEFDE
jgi:hypothetical protein